MGSNGNGRTRAGRLSAMKTDPYAAATTVAMALAEAEAAYAVDADHLARHVIVGLIMRGAVTQDEVAIAVLQIHHRI